ncbi:S8 family serine peptidase [Roseateles asaccharophilus]|uniref:Subtilisin family serine protease n=1 Tax=Roseateles asaccharophilus TaxID=582607 RepID=A0ABU2A681_9BURK|nr:S8 family serine peptidase [Roseateles asaccharophilus]MDR7332704.1 subtilisin family serine protease [Roseateles asaccharophilus]
MKAFFALSLLAATVVAQAQLLPRLPGVERLPGAVDRVLDRTVDRVLQPLPELLSSTTSLLDLRVTQVRDLLRRHPDVIEADPRGELIRRRELVLVSPGEAALAAAAALGLIKLREEAWPELDLHEVVLRVPPGLDTAEALEKLRAAQPDLQADFNHLYARSGNVAAAGRAPAKQTGPVRVGLIDGGVDRRHEALRRAGGGSFGCGGRPVPSEHGTAVASLLVGRDRGFAGAADKAELFAADVYCDQPDGGSAEDVVRALAWMARERVAVVNVSLVGPQNRLLEQGVAALVKRGHLVVAAVGNDGPAAPPLFPASYAGVIGVTGVNASRRVLPEAAQGAQVMWSAPGAEMAVARSGGGYGVARGTSFAAPLVAGLLAAQLRQPDPAAAAAAVDGMATGAIDLGAPGRDPVYGRGFVAEDLRVVPERLQARQQR